MSSALIRSLDSSVEPSADVRRSSARALTMSRDPRRFDALLRSLDPQFENDLDVWSIAAQALPKGDVRALKILVRHLDPDESELSPSWVAHAVAAICQNDPAAVEYLSSLMNPEKEPNPWIRSAIAGCLELALGPPVELEKLKPVERATGPPDYGPPVGDIPF